MADKAFNEVFSNGYERIPNSGQGLLCAMFAIIGSMQAQLPHCATPTVEQLHKVRLRQDVLAVTEQSLMGKEEDKNFLVEHIAYILQAWSQSDGRGMNILLALYTQGTGPSFVWSGEQGPSQTLWIYYNGTNHYEGLRPKNTQGGIGDNNSAINKLSGGAAAPPKVPSVTGNQSTDNDQSAWNPPNGDAVKPTAQSSDNAWGEVSLIFPTVNIRITAN